MDNSNCMKVNRMQKLIKEDLNVMITGKKSIRVLSGEKVKKKDQSVIRRREKEKKKEPECYQKKNNAASWHILQKKVEQVVKFLNSIITFVHS